MVCSNNRSYLKSKPLSIKRGVFAYLKDEYLIAKWSTLNMAKAAMQNKHSVTKLAFQALKCYRDHRF